MKLFQKASQSFADLNPGICAGAGQKDAACANSVRLRGGVMNKTEAEFAKKLDAMKRMGQIRDWKFESVKLRIADGCWYCPDFVVHRPAGEVAFMEVKGFLRDDARVKFLAARTIHNWADFEMWRDDRKNGWTRIY